MTSAFSRIPDAALAFIIILLVSATGTVTAQDWTFRSPHPTANRILSYAHGNGLFVGVGELGEIVTSPDGVTWMTRESGTEEYLQRVVFGANKFVAISSQSILTSSDGIVWNRSTRALFDISFGSGIFVAVARPAVASTEAPCDVLTSTDAVTWTKRASFTSIPARMEFTNGVFVAPTTTGGVLTSADGVTWTAVSVTTSPSSSIYFAAGNNRFLLNFGNVTYLSSDGLAWREVSESHPYQVRVPALGHQSSLGFAGGFFYVQQSRYSSDSYRQYRSSDGEHWLPISVGSLDFSTLVSAGGVSVASEVSRLYASLNPNGSAIHSSVGLGVAVAHNGGECHGSEDKGGTRTGPFFLRREVFQRWTYVGADFRSAHARGRQSGVHDHHERGNHHG